MKINMKWARVLQCINDLYNIITISYPNKVLTVYGIPKGGSIIAGILWNEYIIPIDDVNECDIIINDVKDSGETYNNYKKYKKPIFYLIDRMLDYKNDDIIFPWEL